MRPNQINTTGSDGRFPAEILGVSIMQPRICMLSEREEAC